MQEDKIPSDDFEKIPAQGQDESIDPYLNQTMPTEPLRCPSCGNVFLDDVWHLPGQINELSDQDVIEYTCPGCQKVQDGYYLGELRLKGSFMSEHKDEISELIDNEVKRDQKKNPLAKFVEASEKEGTIHIRTTNAKLAERIGRQLKQAYGGEIEFDDSEFITRVYWERDFDPGEEEA